MKIKTSDTKPDFLILINTETIRSLLGNLINKIKTTGRKYVIEPKGILRYAKSTEK